MLTFSGHGPFHDAGEILVASDPKAVRNAVFVARNEDGNVEVLSKRVGPSGALYTLREFVDAPVRGRYLAEGETLDELAANLADTMPADFTVTMDGSIADVVGRHGLAAIKEIEIERRAR